MIAIALAATIGLGFGFCLAFLLCAGEVGRLNKRMQAMRALQGESLWKDAYQRQLCAYRYLHNRYEELSEGLRRANVSESVVRRN